MEHPIKLVKARTKLLLKFPFFGQLALKCDLKEGTDTMATDGRYFYYNKEFVEETEQQELMGVLVHEILHNAFLHSYRLKGRNIKKWNVACDYAINAIIIEEYGNQLILPSDALYEKDYSGMSAEKIYGLLPEDQSQPVNWGEVLEAKDSANISVAEQEIEWKISITQAAAMGNKRGDIPQSLALQIEGTKAKVTWQEILRSFTLSNSPGDYAWYPPNLQYLHQGLHVPSTQDYCMGPIVVAVDTSGSIDRPMLSRFFAELSSILESCKPEKIHVLYCDTKIAGVEELDQYDLPLTPNPKGGGGTRFEPVFEYIEEKGLDPEWLVYFTDLYGTFPKQPHYPTLWARTSDEEPPFGVVIDLE